MLSYKHASILGWLLASIVVMSFGVIARLGYLGFITPLNRTKVSRCVDRLTDIVVIDLGRLQAGTKVHRTIVLQNQQELEKIIRRITTSCSCLEVVPASSRVLPGGKATLSITFDSTKEPDFVGGLAMDIIGYGMKDEILIKTQVLAEIVSSSVKP